MYLPQLRILPIPGSSESWDSMEQGAARRDCRSPFSEHARQVGPTVTWGWTNGGDELDELDEHRKTHAFNIYLTLASASYFKGFTRVAFWSMFDVFCLLDKQILVASPQLQICVLLSGEIRGFPPQITLRDCIFHFWPLEISAKLNVSTGPGIHVSEKCRGARLQSQCIFVTAWWASFKLICS